jgi:hypothetical protein
LPEVGIRTSNDASHLPAIWYCHECALHVYKLSMIYIDVNSFVYRACFSFAIKCVGWTSRPRAARIC